MENKQTILPPVIIFIYMQNVSLNFKHQMSTEFKVRLKSKGKVWKLCLILIYDKQKKKNCLLQLE